MKSVSTLLEMDLITVNPSSYFDKRGMKWRGNNLYTILPVWAAVNTFYWRQLHQLEVSTARRKAEAKLSRLCTAQEPFAPADHATTSSTV